MLGNVAPDKAVRNYGCLTVYICTILNYHHHESLILLFFF